MTVLSSSNQRENLDPAADAEKNASIKELARKEAQQSVANAPKYHKNINQIKSQHFDKMAESANNAMSALQKKRARIIKKQPNNYQISKSFKELTTYFIIHANEQKKLANAIMRY
jgi:hypothetical protein